MDVLRMAHRMLLAVATTIALALAATLPAAAHAGETHASTGLDPTTLLQVAGAIAVLGAAFLATGRVARSREEAGDRSVDRDSEE